MGGKELQAEGKAASVSVSVSASVSEIGFVVLSSAFSDTTKPLTEINK